MESELDIVWGRSGSSGSSSTQSPLSSYLNHSFIYANDTHFLHPQSYELINHPGVQAIFYVIYTNIFILGIFGNVLVCFVVGRNKAMQTVTNFFITNLALSDILLCALAVPFTPLYTFLEEWVFGRVLCHLVPYAQGTSVYISTLTLTSIAIDRFFVIIYPFKPRMRLTVCLLIITGIWIFALVATLPYGIFLEYKVENGRWVCLESWPSGTEKNIFSACTSTLQFILPFLMISICYVKVSFKLADRAKAKPGSKNSKKEALERERKRRTNRMLIAMVMIFGICWLPINLFNILADVYPDAENWEHYHFLFFISHAIAMSSCCYNPWLYAWLNENFRKEFKQVLPCFSTSNSGPRSSSRRFLSQRTCNGANETVQETLMPQQGGIPGQLLEPIEESQHVTLDLNVSATYQSSTNLVQVHLPMDPDPDNDEEEDELEGKMK